MHQYLIEIVASYRKRGTIIGKKVRLLGSIDGINPHLVSIGDYSVIGAQSALLTHCPIKGAVVTKDVPEGMIVAGNPARVIRVLTDAEKEDIQDKMLNTRLFGWDGEF